ncbi:MAG: hypothetical protein AAB443_02990 [Patescibacteria group bacterium]
MRLKIAFLLLIVIAAFLLFGYYRRLRVIDESLDSSLFLKPVANKSNPPALNGFYYEECMYSDSLSYVKYEENPTSSLIQENIGYVNNKFGLYVYSESTFIKLAEELVNSNGGDWGYVLIPYNVRDFDESKWGYVFELLSKKHLIPILQLWDITPEKYEEETKNAAKFLNKFAWPIKNKYISAYNEMNDSRFWKGRLDPEGYSKVLDLTIREFKLRDPNFFIMNGAFNATAPTIDGYMDQISYMDRMNKEQPGIFERLDGWASHPYPQPGFRGSPYDNGRSSIRAYEWELGVLKDRYGVEVNKLPVFITETGWPHAEGVVYNPVFHDAQKVAEYTRIAFEEVWLKDSRVVAITPFTVFYETPFDHFSWVKKDGYRYPQFETLRKLQKVAGRPPVLKIVDKEILKCN